MRVSSARSFWLPVLLTTLVAAFFGAVLGRRGRHLEGLLARQAGLEQELARLKEGNRRARAERDALLSSPEAIERVAREEYGFAAPGETVAEYQSRRRRPRPASTVTVEVSRWHRLLMWRHLPVLLPMAVFVATAVVFRLWNASSASRHRPGTDEPGRVVDWELEPE
jgi:cell division protein FtsB